MGRRFLLCLAIRPPYVYVALGGVCGSATGKLAAHS